MTGLNASQRSAVACDAPRILCLAPAGSGKTRVLTHRIARLLADGAEPASILAVTFTRRAAGEMQHRVVALLNDETPDLAVTTFHGWASRVLRDHAELVHLTRDYTILDPDERAGMLVQIAHEVGVRCGEKAPKVERLRVHPKIGPHYERALLRLNATDFDGLEAHLLTLLGRAEVRDALGVQCALVDEFQDTSEMQARILDALAPSQIFAVADRSQSIYRWRGARVENVDDYAADATVLKLSHNYRSGRAIVAVGNTIARAAGSALDDVLAGRETDGTVGVHLHVDADAQARAVADSCVAAQTPGDCMVLARTWAELEPVRRELAARDIPVEDVRAKVDEWSSPAMRAIVAALRVRTNPRDEAAVRSLCAWLDAAPARAEWTAAVVEADRTGRSLVEVLADDPRRSCLAGIIAVPLAEEVLGAPVALSAAGVVDHVVASLNGSRGTVRASNLVAGWVRGGMCRGWRDLGPEAFVRWYSARDVEDVPDDGAPAGVRLMTVHAAKGLEAAVVHVIGVDRRAWPRTAAGDGFEEERRLFYVAATRAANELHVHSCALRLKAWGSGEMEAGASPFVDLVSGVAP